MKIKIKRLFKHLLKKKSGFGKLRSKIIIIVVIIVLIKKFLLKNLRNK